MSRTFQDEAHRRFGAPDDARARRARLALHIRLRRQELGLTQRQLAERIGGSHQPYIAKLEQGMANPDFDLLGRILVALDVDPVESLFDRPEPTSR